MLFRLLLLAIFLVGCSGEDRPHSQNIVIARAGEDCLAEFGTYLEKYAQGQMSHGEIGAFWDCTAGAVRDYRRLTAGEGGSDRYKPENVLRFLQRHFLKDHHVSPAMLKSIMEIKRVVINGRSDEITRAELDQLIEFLMVVKRVTQALNPHASILFFNAENPDDRAIEAAGRAFRSEIQVLGEWFERHQQPYTFQQLEDFLAELDRWISSEWGKVEFLSTLNRFMTVLKPAKRLLFAGSHDGFAGTEWVNVFETGGDAYFALLALRYAFEADLTAALTRGVFPEAVLSAVEVLRRGAKLHEGGVIPWSEWQDLFGAIEATEVLPFKADALEGALSWVLERLLATQTRELNADAIARLADPFATWSALNEGRTTRLGEKFEELLARSSPMQWDKEGRMIYSLKSVNEWSEEARRRMVWPFALLNWIKESYVGRDVDELDDEQMLTIMGEVLPVLRGFGLFETTEPSFGLRLLREADLFTSSSQGDGRLQLHEAARYLAIIASGFRAAEIWLERAKPACGGLQAECVRRFAADPANGVLGSLPRLEASLKGQEARVFVEYLRAAEETVLEKPVEGEFSTGDLLQAWVLFQYVEEFVRRFDGDKTETISLAESEAAFELFGPTLKALLDASGLPEEEFRAFFTFLMKYGDTPFTMFGGHIAWLHWKWNPERWQFESNRRVLLGILNQLSKL